MDERDFSKEFNTMINEILAPFLKKLNFKKKGLNFYRQTEELIQTFNFQKSQFNNKEDISFTGNIGLIEPDSYLILYQTDLLPIFPKCTDSIIQMRLGMLTDKRDYWYELNKRINLDDLKSKIQLDLKVLEEFIENHRTILSLKPIIEDMPGILVFWGEIGRFVLYKKLGEDKTARIILEKAYNEAKIPRNQSINLYWIEQIEKVAKIYDEKLNSL